MALPGEQGASALACDPEGHWAKICRCWSLLGGGGLVVGICLGRPPGVRFPAGRDGAGPGEQLARARREKEGVQLGIQSELLHPCSVRNLVRGPGAVGRLICWERPPQKA